jgi:hypothetical protein
MVKGPARKFPARKAPAGKTPVRSALVETSELLAAVVDGLGAVEAGHRDLFDHAIRTEFADSLDLDRATKPGREEQNRWDYLLGHGPSGEVVAVEPHSAKDGHVSTVVNKLAAARNHLKGHLRDGVKIRKWIWVSAGKVHFANTEKTKLHLLENGIQFAGTKITAKHVAPSSSPTSAPPHRGKRR